MAEYIITQADLDKGNSYLKTLTTEHPVCRIADGVTGIPNNAFFDCSGLTSITIPDSAFYIGRGTFNGCTGLTSIIIGNDVTSIMDNAFVRCISLTSITIPNGVITIGNHVFEGCTSLTSITIPDSVTTIGNSAFDNCTSLTSITIPEGVTSIGRGAFNYCSSLTSIIIGNSVTSIGDDVFAGCSNLKTIYASEGFDTTLLDGKVPEGATILVKHMVELITLSQLKAYDDEKTNIWHNSFTTNNLTVNSSTVVNAVINSANVADLTVNNAVINSANVADLTVNSSTVVNGNVFTHKGFDVASINVISEYYYNQLGAAARNDAFYVTGPNGNMYFMGAKWTPSYVPSCSIAYVQLPRMADNMTSLTTSTLTFTSGAVTNNFVNGGKLNSIYNKTPFGGFVDMSLSVGTQANDGSIITNANELYITDASYMYNNCVNLTDTFVCNPSLITNAPSDYDPMRYCTNMESTFSSCYNFNQPVNIPDGVIYMTKTFSSCYNFNQPVNIPDGVTYMTNTFSSCYNFNQPVNIPDSVIYMKFTFASCYNFNQPVNIPDSVTQMRSTFSSCYSFNQPVTLGNNVKDMGYAFAQCNNFNQPVNIPDTVTNMDGTFSRCNNFNQPVSIPGSVTHMMQAFFECNTLRNSTVPIHISHTIELGNRSNYIYNSLINGLTGISFAPSRILNDL